MSADGPVATAVRAELALMEQETGTLGQLALALAQKLDGDAGMATAAVSKELRATLDALRPKERDEPADALARFLADLSSPVRDSKD